jgi:predicted DNA-binding transcriptional regulator YafY
MQLEKYITRLCYAHKLIRSESTGSAKEFARKLHIGKSQFYCLLEEFKFVGAKIEYDHIRKTYYYLNDFELIIDIRVLTGDEERKFFAGSATKKIKSPIFPEYYPIIFDIFYYS